MRVHRLAVGIALILFPAWLARPVRAAVPTASHFQGRLTTSSGAPVADTTTQTLSFRLYNAASGGALLWSQASSGVTVKGGVFSAPLNFAAGFTGANTLDSVLAGTAFLEVQAGADPPMKPRLPLTSGPYALRARTAENVTDGSITGAKIAPGAITSANLSLELNQTLNVLATASDPRPVPRGIVPTGSHPTSVAAAGPFAYVTSTVSGTLQVFDATKPDAPILRGTVATVNTPECVAVSGSTVCVVGNNPSSLQVFDVSNPAAPTLRGSLPLVDGVARVVVSGNLACVINYLKGTLQVIDVSNPSAPVQKGSVGTAPGPQSLAFSGSLAAVGFYGQMQFFDVSDPGNPVLKRRIFTGSYYANAALSGSTAYVTSTGLQVYDVSNPSDPVLKGTAATQADPYGVEANGGTVYVLSGGSIETFDVGDPAAPALLASTPTKFPSNDVVIGGGLAYATAGDNSVLQVFSLNAVQVRANLAVGGGGTFGGNVGIGTTTPGFPLTFANTLGDKISLWGQSGKSYGLGIGNGQLQIHSYDENYDIVFGTGPSPNIMETARIKGNGDLRVVGDVYARGVKLTSDGRYKRNVRTLDNALDTVLGLRGVAFDWDRTAWPARRFPDGQQIGFIAQEVEKVLPQVVGTDANGYKSVAYQNVVPVLVEGMKEQERQLETLKAENERKLAEKDAQIASLEQRLERLEERVNGASDGGRP
jgi:hypothetical protein